MIEAFPQLSLPFFKFLQLRHFFISTPAPSEWCRPLTPVEQLCNAQGPQRHLVSSLYALLVSHAKPHTAARTLWDKELSSGLSDTDWERVWENVHKGSVNVSAQENRFKLCARWYRTPDKLHRIFPAVPPECWRCGTATVSLLHIWWDCPRLQPFWKEIHDRYVNITTLHVDFTPAQFLLHHTSLPRFQYHKYLALHLINAATQSIPL